MTEKKVVLDPQGNKVNPSIVKASELLSEAHETLLVRGASYGDPVICHTAIADTWSAYLKQKFQNPEHIRLQPRDVAMMMVMMKCIRDAHSPREDNCTDILGYGALAHAMEFMEV